MYSYLQLLMWAILAFSLALLGSNQVRGQRGTAEALALVALGCALSLFVHYLLILLS